MIFEALMTGGGLALGKAFLNRSTLSAAGKGASKAMSLAVNKGRAMHSKFPLISRTVTSLGAAYGANEFIVNPITKHQREAYLSRYGDTEENRAITDMFPKVAMVGLAGLAGTSIVGPSVAGAVKGAAQGASFMAKKISIPRINRSASALSAPKAVSASMPKKGFIRRHPDISAFVGAGTAGIIGGSAAHGNRPFMANEGRITAMNSAPMGGISPELQFSTMGLPTRIHDRRKNRGL